MKFWMVSLILLLAVGFVASPVLACDPDGCGGCDGDNNGGCGGDHQGDGHKCDPNGGDGGDQGGDNGGGCGGDCGDCGGH
ncbi:MAG: hypothetical protein GX442_19820 [Candidatus Riflebacteria bacterium]|nr:hypothetical protein [Candidatus Riflebacteria bacterium]